MSKRKFILCFAVLLAFVFFVAQTSSVSAKPKKAKNGTIKILDEPGRSPTDDRWKPLHGENSD